MRNLIYTFSCLVLVSCGSPTQKHQTSLEESLPEEPAQPETSETTIMGKDSVINITVNGTIAGHEYVDLGLPSGTLWATTNLGSKSADNIGDCYAWGETRVFKENRKYKFEKDGKLTKYCVDSLLGVVDSLFVLQPEDDAATANWGRQWCMPTNLQMKELFKYCRIERRYDYYLDGGIYFISNFNNNKLYFPLSSGANTYWTSSINWQENDRAEFYIELLPTESMSILTGLRKNAALIRPVVKNEDNIQNAIKYIDRCYNEVYPNYRGIPSDSPVIVDCKAEYPGGLDSLKEYIKKNTVYPNWAREQGIKGKSIIQFIIEKDGTISHVDTLRAFNIELDKEAIRVIKSAKGWKPAKTGNVAVRSRMVCLVPFGTKE